MALRATILRLSKRSTASRRPEGIYTETAYTAVGTTRKRVVVQSLSKENIDQPVLVNGDLPESADEVAVTSKFLKASGKKLGDTVRFAANDASSSNQSAKDQFAAGEYTHYGRGPRPHRRELRLDRERLSRCFGGGL